MKGEVVSSKLQLILYSHIRYGKVDRVKKIKDYAFVHFEDRKQAIAAMQVGRNDTTSVARWQNLIPSLPWIAPGWRAWGSVAEP